MERTKFADGSVTEMLAAFFDWRGAELVFNSRKPPKDLGLQTGLVLFVIEFHDLSEEDKKVRDLPISVGNTFCHVGVVNLRKFARQKP